MKPSYDICLLTLVACLTSGTASCGQSQPSKSEEKVDRQQPQPVQIDTAKTAIIPFDSNRPYPFDKTYTAAVLTQSDIRTIENLLITCVANYNKSLKFGREYREIDLSKRNYRKQLVAVVNAKGEKEVWVNCFCYDPWKSDKWKRDIIEVDDGGSCFFNFSINLTTKKVYRLMVNGVA